MSVCCEDNMYTLSDEYVEKTKEDTGAELNNLFIENDYFAKEIERYYFKVIDSDRGDKK